MRGYVLMDQKSFVAEGSLEQQIDKVGKDMPGGRNSPTGSGSRK